MNELVLKGKTKVCGIQIPCITGGFGENKKSMLAKDIGKIHGREVKHVNELINNNRKRFKDNVDIIDLLEVGLDDTEIKKYGFTQQSINSYRGLKSKGLNAGIYVLSERGYAKLLKIFDDDLAWERYDQILDEYFEVKEEVEKTGAYITNKANPEMLREKADEIESLSVVNETLKIVMDRIDKLPIAEESKVLVMKGILKKAGVDLPIDVTAEEKYYDTLQIGKEVGMYSSSGKPHSQAISAILGNIEILEIEKKDVWETNGSWQGTVTKYTRSVVEKVVQWLIKNNYPPKITIKLSNGKDRNFAVVYKEVA